MKTEVCTRSLTKHYALSAIEVHRIKLIPYNTEQIKCFILKLLQLATKGWPRNEGRTLPAPGCSGYVMSRFIQYYQGYNDWIYNHVINNLHA